MAFRLPQTHKRGLSTALKGNVLKKIRTFLYRRMCVCVFVCLYIPRTVDVIYEFGFADYRLVEFDDVVSGLKSYAIVCPFNRDDGLISQRGRRTRLQNRGPDRGYRQH